MIHTFNAPNKPRLIAWVDGDDMTSQGTDWNRRPLVSYAFCDSNVNSFTVNVSSGRPDSVPYRFKIDSDWISVSKTEGEVSGVEKITVSCDREKLSKCDKKSCTIFIENDDRSCGRVSIPLVIYAKTVDENLLPHNEEGGIDAIIQNAPYIAFDAERFNENVAGIDKDGRVTCFEVLPEYGKLNSAVKVESVTSYFKEDLKNSPSLKYDIFIRDDIEYFGKENDGNSDGIYKVDFYMNPSNPATKDNYFKFGAAVNGKKVLVDVVDENFRVGDNQFPWGDDITNHIRVKSAYFEFKKGMNTLEVFAVTPNFVLEKIVISPKNYKVRESYLGPR